MDAGYRHFRQTIQRNLRRKGIRHYRSERQLRRKRRSVRRDRRERHGQRSHGHRLRFRLRLHQRGRYRGAEQRYDRPLHKRRQYARQPEDQAALRQEDCACRLQFAHKRHQRGRYCRGEQRHYHRHTQRRVCFRRQLRRNRGAELRQDLRLRKQRRCRKHLQQL